MSTLRRANAQRRGSANSALVQDSRSTSRQRSMSRHSRAGGQKKRVVGAPAWGDGASYRGARCPAACRRAISCCPTSSHVVSCRLTRLRRCRSRPEGLAFGSQQCRFRTAPDSRGPHTQDGRAHAGQCPPIPLRAPHGSSDRPRPIPESPRHDLPREQAAIERHLQRTHLAQTSEDFRRIKEGVCGVLHCPIRGCPRARG